MPLELTVVDAFTTVPFAGNPAAVAVVEVFPDGPQMQAIAAEVNLSETAFVVDRSDGEHDLRWFTPTTEVDLCGHATLASAHVLGRSVRFHTKSGILHCEVNDDRIEMDFPAQPIEKAERPVQLDFPGVRWYGVGDFFAFVELEDAAVLRTLEPDLQMVASLGTRALIVTAAGDRPDVDCVSRVFAPNVGIPEDPVTGSAHCALALYWADRLGRDALVGEQASARGGVVRMRERGDRVTLGGQAISVATVRLLV